MEVRLSHSSIKKAIEKAEKYTLRYNFDDILKKFFERCYMRIIELANIKLDNISGFYETDMKSRIKTSWSFVVTGNVMTVVNNSDKAVYIEFGVGAVGEESPHPQASEAGYEYNIPTKYKKDDGTWSFYIKFEELEVDLRSKNYEIKSLNRGQRIRIKTRGNEAGLYTYNALMDFVINQEGQKIWSEILEGK